LQEYDFFPKILGEGGETFAGVVDVPEQRCQFLICFRFLFAVYPEEVGKFVWCCHTEID
jgi:hypothetical protein